MLISEFSIYLGRLEKTPSRLEIVKILQELFEESTKENISEIIYLSLGVLAPNYEGVLLNLAEKTMLKIISRAFLVDELVVLEEYKKVGDLGNLAQSLAEKNKREAEKIRVEEVFEYLKNVASINGEGSKDKKIELMVSLLSKLDPLSVRFLVRIAVSNLRLGFSEKTILDALSKNDKVKKNEIVNAYNIRPDIGYIGKLVKENKLLSITPKVGVPVVPMLAARIKSEAEMIKKMGKVAVEPKFDGLRIFIHFRRKKDQEDKDFIRIFTRNMNYLDVDIFPELKDFGKFVKADEIILDTEAVGIDPTREILLDFQKTITRRRKHEIFETSNKLPLQFQVFDCLLLDGKNLIGEEYVKRRELIEKNVINGSLLRVDDFTVTQDPEVIKKLHHKYLDMGLEGVVVKKALGKYVSGRTGWNWVKMKEEEGMKGKLSDTLDCIVMGYYKGKGKRAQFGLGKILVGIKDSDNILTLTKVGTGLTEDNLSKMKNILDGKSSTLKPKEYQVDKDLVPDVWVYPEVIVEIAADSISVSPKHSLGFSLRFPKFLRFREDKDVNSATTLSEFKDLFKQQKN